MKQRCVNDTNWCCNWSWNNPSCWINLKLNSNIIDGVLSCIHLNLVNFFNGFIQILSMETDGWLNFCQLSVDINKLSSPGPKPLAPKPQKPKNLKPRGLGLTLKSHGPPPHPITFKHEGGVPQKSSKIKNGSEWSGRTWSSPPCSVKTSSTLLVASLSKCQHSG